MSYSIPETTPIKLCPLVDIGIVFNSIQVWANIQGSTDPSSQEFSFSFEDTECWKPLFREGNVKTQKDFNTPFACIQEPALLYYPMPATYFQKRQERVCEPKDFFGFWCSVSVLSSSDRVRFGASI